MSAVVRTIYEYDRPLTVEAFEGLPEGDGKQELVDGRVVEMSPVGDVHGLVALEVGVALRAHVRRRRRRNGPPVGHVRVETGYRLQPGLPGAPGTRAPDVSYYRAGRVPPTRGIVRGFPDLAVEVLSPGEGPGAVQVKVQEYLAAGVPLVWVLDPDPEAVTVHRPGRPPRVLGAGDVLTGEDVLPGFRLPLAELWATVAAEYEDAADGAAD